MLKGYAAEQPDDIQAVGRPFSKEPYGKGLPKDDDNLRDAINDSLDENRDNGAWQLAFEYAFGSSKGVEQPKPDRY